jgi:cytochrome P450
MTTVVDDLRIEDPIFYLNDPFPVYARLRVEDPVHLREDLRIWTLTRYDDIVSVAKQPVLFSCERGTLLQDAITGRSLAEEYFVGDEFVENTDPPRHNELRRLISPAFTPKSVAMLEDGIRRSARDMVAALPVGKSVEYIGTVAAILPLVVIARLLGVGPHSVEELGRWNSELMKVGLDLSDAERAASVAAFQQMNDFIRAQFERKRAEPAHDLLSTLLVAHDRDSEKVTEDNILTWAALVLAGGAETTQALLGNTVENLAHHPAQLTAVAARPRDLSSRALEEVLRWKTLAHGFVRTVSEDTDFGGKQLKQGDWVYMLHQAANWDPEVFSNPSVFDIMAPRLRDNLAFGVGQHFCPGNRLSRLEGRVLLEELVARFPRWQIDHAVPVESVLRTGFTELHVTFNEA